MTARSEVSGTYVLCGYSFGGRVAFEMAQLLSELGHADPHLILIDPTLVGLPLLTRLRGFIRRQQNRLSRPDKFLKPEGARRIDPVIALHERLARRHRPSVYRGSTVVISSAVRRRRMRDDLLGLKPLLDGPIEAHNLGGNHVELLRDDSARQVGAVIADVVERLMVSRRT